MSPAPLPFDVGGPLEAGTIVLEASAGTGKTYTIASLVLRLVVAENVPLPEILVVTFTEAATAELRDRVRERLAAAREAFRDPCGAESADPLIAWLRERVDPQQARARLDAALAGFDEATIATIHGFCHRVLAENAFESGVTYDTELLSDVRPLLADVVQDVWTEETFDVSPEWLEANASLKVDSLEGFAQFVCRALDVEIEPPSEDVQDRWRALVAEIRGLGSEEHSAALESLRVAVEGDGMYKDFGEKLAGRWEVLREWLERPGGEGFEAPPADADAFAPAAIAKKTKVGWKKAEGVPGHRLFDLLGELLALRDSALVGLRRRLVDRFRAAFEARKAKRGVWSFDDLLERLRRAVRAEDGDALRERLRRRFRAVLIDEFQDTDAVQWEIFHRTFPRPGGWLCLIGDPKQAIYRFRGGDVYTYLKARADATHHATLDRNWRSDPRFVLAVNTVFGGPGEGEFQPFLDPRVPFTPVGAAKEDRLRFGGEPGPALRFVVRPAAVATERAAQGKAPAKDEFEEDLPARVASELVRLLRDADCTLVEGEEVVPLLPRHVAVLTRTNAQARDVQSELRRRGVPSILHGDASVFSTEEARELRRILEAALDPARERLVRGALATDLLGWPAERIDALTTSAGDEWIDLLDELKELRHRWDARGVVAMLQQLFASRGVVERTLGLAGGERRMTNVVHLVELLHRAAREERLGPAALVRWLARQIEREKEGGYSDREAAQVRLESDADAVQITTVHKSKGLEYPVVFAPWLWSARRAPGKSKWFLDVHLTKEGDRHVLNLMGGADVDVGNRAHEEEREEELRLAYVALTRARHLCVVHHGVVNLLEHAPLGHLLHRGALPTEESLRADLDALALRSGGTIGWIEDAGSSRQRYEAPVDAGDRLEVAVLGRDLDRAFRTSSFSALVKGMKGPAVPAGSPDETGEEQDDPAEEPARRAARSASPVPLADFVRGTRAGRFLHRVLETADFRPEARGGLVAEVERWRRFYAIPPAVASSSIADALGRALDAPLDERGHRLSDVPPERRWNELAFLFPVAERQGAVTAARLAEVIRRHGPPAVSEDVGRRLGALAFPPLRGFLKGYVDLVYQDGEGDDARVWVVDFKSNFLGPTHDDYAPDALRDAMRVHDYDLQALLYVVAVHRFLSLRRIGYDPARHLGGARYLFLRGMDRDHPGRGVVEIAPSVELVRALDRVLAEPRSEA